MVKTRMNLQDTMSYRDKVHVLPIRLKVPDLQWHKVYVQCAKRISILLCVLGVCTGVQNDRIDIHQSHNFMILAPPISDTSSPDRISIRTLRFRANSWNVLGVFHEFVEIQSHSQVNVTACSANAQS